MHPEPVQVGQLTYSSTTLRPVDLFSDTTSNPVLVAIHAHVDPAVILVPLWKAPAGKYSGTTGKAGAPFALVVRGDYPSDAWLGWFNHGFSNQLA